MPPAPLHMVMHRQPLARLARPQRVLRVPRLHFHRLAARIQLDRLDLPRSSLAKDVFVKFSVAHPPASLQTTPKSHSISGRTVAEAARRAAPAGAGNGYFSLEEIGRLQELTLKTGISDPRRDQRRRDKLESAQRQPLVRAQRSVKSNYGRALLRKRGQHIEGSFAHVLDAGGMRRATLGGLENLNKRHQFAAACYNLSQLLCRLYGVGTPKQWAAGFSLLLARLFCLPMGVGLSLVAKQRGSQLIRARQMSLNASLV